MYHLTAWAQAPKHFSPGKMTSTSEIVFDLDAAAFSGDTFRMYEFKVKRCPRVKPHDFAGCPFAHSGEKAKRRDPRTHKYSGTACPEFRRNGCCRRADTCPFAHGIFECWMHPSRYRTQMCSEVLECKRRVCFFAHTEDELRKPVDDAVWMQQHGTGFEFEAGVPSTPTTQDTQTAFQPAPGALPPAQGTAAAANPNVWGLLQHLASNGTLDANQVLQLVQAINTGPAAAAPRAPTPGTTAEEFMQSLPALKSRHNSNAGIAAMVQTPTADDAPPASSPLITTSVAPSVTASLVSEPPSPDPRSPIPPLTAGEGPTSAEAVEAIETPASLLDGASTVAAAAEAPADTTAAPEVHMTGPAEEDDSAQTVMAMLQQLDLMGSLTK